jgi:hypothetical protein
MAGVRACGAAECRAARPAGAPGSLLRWKRRARAAPARYRPHLLNSRASGLAVAVAMMSAARREQQGAAAAATAAPPSAGTRHAARGRRGAARELGERAGAGNAPEPQGARLAGEARGHDGVPRRETAGTPAPHWRLIDRAPFIAMRGRAGRGPA